MYITSKKNNKIKSFFYLILILLLLGTYFFFRQVQKDYLSVTSFEECRDAGYEILTTYPEQCKIPGKIFVNTKQSASVATGTEDTIISEKNMNPKNATYIIEGSPVTLQDNNPTLASSSATSISYFGNELRMDLNDDKTEDSAFLVTSNSSGSGTFYYLVVALYKNGEYKGTNGVFLGDRIAPQTTEFINNEIVVNYADRKIDEPMTKKPSIGVSRYFKVINETLTEITK